MLRFKGLIFKPIAIKSTGGGFPACKGIRRGCHSINFLPNGRVKTSFEVGEKTDRVPTSVVFVFFKTNNIVIDRGIPLSNLGKL